MLVRDVLLQTLLAAEQLVTFVTLEQLVTWEEGCFKRYTCAPSELIQLRNSSERRSESNVTLSNCPRTVRSDVSVEVAAVLEDLVAEGAAVNPFVLSSFVSLQNSPAVWSALCCCCCCCLLWGHRL